MVLTRSKEMIEIIKDVRWACTAGRKSYVIDVPGKARWMTENPVITRYGVPYIFQNRQQIIGANKLLDMMLSNSLVKHYLLGTDDDKDLPNKVTPVVQKGESVKEETTQEKL